MKVKELIEELEMMDQNSEVYFAYDYGDRIHTQVAALVENTDEERIIYSAYHKMAMVLENDEDDSNDEARGVKEVVVLSS